MLTLTSVQEAAFNAAGEAMADLHTDGFTFHLGRGLYASGDDVFQAFTSRNVPQTVWGKGATATAAVANLLVKVEEARNAPPKLTTAREAVDAVKQIVSEIAEGDGALGESDMDSASLISRLDALPVA